ncbi:type VI secretion system-associated protein TagF [Caulobacter sp. UNC279MFTsu5.1]|uniref:type VI secretion system-associated protein TagF n=1 Tax=Caulobacter sp. UNC279MFTsu5.1 TaxID=1502775 RepID=UPI000B7F8CA8|nr:type VI secretion system-associated protein TagF [Caulobacter sp. UNC279MFTsu5.1]
MPSQALTAPSAFAFGKLPSHGDFVARGLSGPDRDAWDAWASAGLAQARTALGADFEARHDAAPPLRFAFGPGPFGEGWRTGALAPSIDSAGRRFIIVLGGYTTLAPSAPITDQIAAAAEDQIHRAFEDAADIDAMVVSAQNIFQTLESEGGAEAQGRFWLPDSPFDLIASQPPADLIVQVLTT